MGTTETKIMEYKDLDIENNNTIHLEPRSEVSEFGFCNDKKLIIYTSSALCSIKHPGVYKVLTKDKIPEILLQDKTKLLEGCILP